MGHPKVKTSEMRLEVGLGLIVSLQILLDANGTALSSSEPLMSYSTGTVGHTAATYVVADC